MSHILAAGFRLAVDTCSRLRCQAGGFLVCMHIERSALLRYVVNAAVAAYPKAAEVHRPSSRECGNGRRAAGPLLSASDIGTARAQVEKRS